MRRIAAGRRDRLQQAVLAPGQPVDHDPRMVNGGRAGTDDRPARRATAVTYP
ncbi:hypothetical protein J2S41_002116 [Catenuloplanes atrovinosus]|uniref:Uncharacterized protein n=1 Tax=Catenuloplanes atrovinosus TaxID=137266 RepID=A0AAE4C8T7_9ACTN|nr:hypothetical protein [Catenuloplanes atrovinosus]